MEMLAIADPEAGDVEDEDRVAVLYSPVAAAVVEQIAADVGGYLADIDVADALGDFRRRPVIVPAMQHVLNVGIGKQRIMGAVGAVHGDDIGQPVDPVGAIPVGRDSNSAWCVDGIGGMADIADG